MRKVFKVALLVFLLGLVASCNKSDDDEKTPIRDYAVQSAADLSTTQTFLKTHSITVTNNPGAASDQDVSYTTVPELDPTAIWGSNAEAHGARLLEWPVERDGVTYIIYYRQLRQGSG